MNASLQLKNFKLHTNLCLNFAGTINLIHGKNNIGKTSALEAINLLQSTSKQNFSLFIKDNEQFFEIFFATENRYKLIFSQNEKKLIINETEQKSTKIHEYLSTFFLSPYVISQFWNDCATKRQILNKIISKHNPNYAVYYSEYNKALKKRNELIFNNEWNKHWQTSIDTIIKSAGIKINNIRKEAINILNNQAQIDNLNLFLTFFPNFETQHEIFCKELDAKFQGIHTTKFNISNNLDHRICHSTQNSLLIELILLSFKQSGTENILLLDDILSCFDAQTTENILNKIHAQNVFTIIANVNKIENSFINNLSF